MAGEVFAAGCFFAELVELAVERQDECGVLCNSQILRCDADTLARELFDFGRQSPGIDDNTVADYGQFAGTDNAGWQQRQLIGGSVDDKRMTGIVAALEADDGICPF